VPPAARIARRHQTQRTIVAYEWRAILLQANSIGALPKAGSSSPPESTI
jgi:hypothetical protein